MQIHSLITRAGWSKHKSFPQGMSAEHSVCSMTKTVSESQLTRHVIGEHYDTASVNSFCSVKGLGFLTFVLPSLLWCVYLYLCGLHWRMLFWWMNTAIIRQPATLHTHTDSNQHTHVVGFVTDLRLDVS